MPVYLLKITIVIVLLYRAFINDFMHQVCCDYILEWGHESFMKALYMGCCWIKKNLHNTGIGFCY
jgi:hypothetical protein